ncbi:MAG TPA: hypothetical protein VJQ55_13130, partial [Candidatus Binatia bacterium]|nr:hypothetical protein [Candidatus Binatia bacterium]
AGRLLRLLEHARHERVMRDADDRNDLSHGSPPAFVAWFLSCAVQACKCPPLPQCCHSEAQPTKNLLVMQW